MPFELKVLGPNNRQINLKPDSNNPEEHFALCLFFFLELASGSQNLNNMANQLNELSEEELLAFQLATRTFTPDSPVRKKFSIRPSSLTPMQMILEFLNLLTNLAYFQEIVAAATNNRGTNPYQQFISDIINFKNIAKEPEIEKRFNQYVIDLARAFTVPQKIAKINISLDESTNQQALYTYAFPEELIPKEFICTLTQFICDEPCNTSSANTYIEKKALEKHYEHSKIDPLTNTPVENRAPIINQELKQKIELFISKVKCIFENAAIHEITYLYYALKSEITAHTTTLDTLREAITKAKQQIFSPDQVDLIGEHLLISGKTISSTDHQAHTLVINSCNTLEALQKTHDWLKASDPNSNISDELLDNQRQQGAIITLTIGFISAALQGSYWLGMDFWGYTALATTVTTLIHTIYTNTNIFIEEGEHACYQLRDLMKALTHRMDQLNDSQPEHNQALATTSTATMTLKKQN